MPRRIRYHVAASLDGYIAGPNGEFDWIEGDPDIDFGEVYNQFDTLLVGRGTFESMVREQGSAAVPGMNVMVFSRTLKQEDYPSVTIVARRSEKVLNAPQSERARSGQPRSKTEFEGVCKRMQKMLASTIVESDAR